MDSQELIQWIIARHQDAKMKNPRTSLRLLAKRIGIHNSTLSRILRGKQEMSAKTLLQIKNLQNLELKGSNVKSIPIQNPERIAQVIANQP